MCVVMYVAYGRPNRWAVWAETLRGDCWHPGDGFRPVGRPAGPAGWPAGRFLTLFDAILTLF